MLKMWLQVYSQLDVDSSALSLPVSPLSSIQDVLFWKIMKAMKHSGAEQR